MGSEPLVGGMDARTALRSAALYRTGATVSFLVGVGIAGAGLLIGNPGPLLRALPPGPPVLNTAHLTGGAPSLVLAVVGILVWQLGSTTTYYYTLTEATARESAGAFDSEKVKSDILAVLDERLAEIHEDVEATRQAVDAPSAADRSARSTGPQASSSTEDGDEERRVSSATAEASTDADGQGPR